MSLYGGSREPIDSRVAQLFALVVEALGGATDALLSNDRQHASAIVAADRVVDQMTDDVVRMVWDEIGASANDLPRLRQLVSVLLILPELERSADLAEHIAQRALSRLGGEMNPLARGIVQRMAEVATEMWQTVADAYQDRSLQGVALDDADTELDILRDRLIEEAGASGVSAAVAGQMTLLARFYERLGDHAVNLARRIDRIVSPEAS